MLDRRTAAGRGSAMGVGRPDSAKGLSNKSDFNDFTPARMNSGRGDFRFSGLVRRPPFFVRSVRIGIGARPAYRPQHCPARRDYRSECPTDLRHRSYTERSRTGESRFSPRSSFGAVRSGFDPRILFPDLPAAMSAVRRPFRAADRIRPKKTCRYRLRPRFASSDSIFDSGSREPCGSQLPGRGPALRAGGFRRLRARFSPPQGSELHSQQP